MSNRLRLSVLIAIFAVILGFAAFVAVSPAQQENSLNPCRYFPAYHEVYDQRDGTFQRFDENTAVEALQNVIDCMLVNLSTTGSNQFRIERENLALGEILGIPRWARSFYETELIAVLEPSEAVKRQRTVARRIFENLNRGSITEFVNRSSGVQSVLKRLGWTEAERSSAGLVKGYHERCRSVGVPVPPKMTSRGWSDYESLTEEVKYYFLGKNADGTRIRSYMDNTKGQTDGGFCISFVRTNEKNETISGIGAPALGTICTDKDMSFACFFDSLRYGKDGGIEQMSIQQAENTEFSETVHPNDFKDVCINCHVGQNPFIRHPASIMGTFIESHYPVCKKDCRKFFTTVPLLPEKQSQPWKNAAALNSGNSGCFKCHDLPSLERNSEICGTVFENAAWRTMPPHKLGFKGSHVGWPYPFTGYSEEEKKERYCFRYPSEDEANAFKEYFSSVRALTAYCQSDDPSNVHLVDPGPGEACKETGWLLK